MTAPDRMWAPISEPFSSTQTETSWPAFAASCFNRIAAQSPDGPPPTTTTSYSIASRVMVGCPRGPGGSAVLLQLYNSPPCLNPSSDGASFAACGSKLDDGLPEAALHDDFPAALAAVGAAHRRSRDHRIQGRDHRTHGDRSSRLRRVVAMVDRQ